MKRCSAALKNESVNVDTDPVTSFALIKFKPSCQMLSQTFVDRVLCFERAIAFGTFEEAIFELCVICSLFVSVQMP